MNVGKNRRIFAERECGQIAIGHDLSKVVNY